MKPGRFWRVAAVWFGVLSAVVVFANGPRDGGSLKPEFVWAGFPWTFAFWYAGDLQAFETGPFLADVALGLGAAAVLALGCALARRYGC
jgi:hypothetical protein